MSIQGIRAGKAFVEFFINDDAVNSGLAKVSKQLASWGRKGLAVSGSILAGFGAAATAFSDTGDVLDKMSKRTGVSVESLSELTFAAGQSGVEMATVEKAMKELQKNGISPLEFDKIANNLSAIPDHTVRAQKAIEIFGSKAGVALLPLLDDLPALRQQARDLGLTWSTEDANAAALLNDQVTILKKQFMAMVYQIGAAVAGPLSAFLGWTQSTLAVVIQWAHENPVLFKTIALIAVAVAAVSTAMIAFGSIAALVATAIGGITTAVGGLGAALGVLAANPLAWILGLAAAAVVGVGAIAAATYFGSSSVGSPSAATAPVVTPQTAGMAAASSNRNGGDQSISLLKELVVETAKQTDLIARNVFGLPAGAF